MYEDQYGQWHDLYWHHMGGFWDLIVLLLVIAGIVFLIQGSSKPSLEGPKQGDSAMDTLKKRYASGEINAEEFPQKKKDLES